MKRFYAVKHMLDMVLYSSNMRRIGFFVLCDIAIISLSLYLAFLLRFEFLIPAAYLNILFKALPLFVVVKIAVFAAFRMYHMSWRYVGVRDLWHIFAALLVSEALLMMIFGPSMPSLPYLSYFSVQPWPRSLFPIDGLLSLLLLGGLRVSKRMVLEVFLTRKAGRGGKRTIIMGAGNTGDRAIRYLLNSKPAEFYPVAMLDDRTEKIGSYLHGIKVFGPFRELPLAVAKYQAEAVIVALADPDSKLLRNIYDAAKAAHIATVKIVPRFYDYSKPSISMKNLEEISIEDLVGRRAIKIEYDEIGRFIEDRVVMVTGAGGSIGSEIAMQVCSFNPRQVYLFDIDETELHNLELRMKRAYPGFNFADNGDGGPGAEKSAHGGVNISCVVGDVRDHELLDSLFGAVRPDILFHAAAYKHVPMMEANSNEAVKVNMFGTWNLAEASVRHGVKKFVMISTDKAVRPTSVMGATKRMAEYICKAHNDPQGTQFISVRFGNVLGSRGSVLPLFLEQLKQGGPLTVTHEDMKRYFMTIPEAVSLVLQAALIGKGGGVMVLDMGEPVRIVDLACELIRIHGLEPYKDVDISFVGLRPGEKLFEEMFTAEEGTIASKHDKVFIARDSVHYGLKDMETILEEFRVFLTVTPHNGNGKLRALLRKYVRTFEDDEQKNRSMGTVPLKAGIPGYAVPVRPLAIAVGRGTVVPAKVAGNPPPVTFVQAKVGS